ncbi:MAG: signal peptidase I [Treponema sp.]|nr:signal peptidase I [Treponema sp.]
MAKWTHYSYKAQQYQRHRIIKGIFIFFILYVVYNLFTAFFLSVWTVNNNTMQTALSAGDRLIFTSFSPLIFKKDAENPLLKRGSIVLVDMGRNKDRKLPLRITDGAVRFFTMQKISIFSSGEQYYVKRIIALPGDEISMTNYIFRVKTPGSSYSLTEFELSDRPYQPVIPQTLDVWNDSIPFSPEMASVVLGPDECFVISDDRGNTNDSRTWGAISPSLITSRAVLRFWPLNKIERF